VSHHFTLRATYPPPFLVPAPWPNLFSLTLPLHRSSVTVTLARGAGGSLGDGDGIAIFGDSDGGGIAVFGDGDRVAILGHCGDFGDGGAWRGHRLFFCDGHGAGWIGLGLGLGLGLDFGHSCGVAIGGLGLGFCLGLGLGLGLDLGDR
jgi:hypothetical protein